MNNIFYYKNILKAALFTGCFFVTACENDIKEVQALGKKKINVEEAIDMVSYLSQGGVVKAKLTAPLMLRAQADTPYAEFPKSLHVDFYDSLTNVESQLFAKYGRYLETKGLVLLKDSVLVFNVKGDTMWTNELWWDQNKGSFYTDKRVDIHKKNGDKIPAYGGMTATSDFKDIQFKNVLQGSMTVADTSLPK